MFVLLFALVGFTTANSLTINTTSVKSGDWVRVSWEDKFTMKQLSEIKPHKTVWDDGLVKILPVGSGAGSYWVGQFSPAVLDLSEVQMTGDPAHGGGQMVTEGTPPYTTPAPVKFISGTQLTKGSYSFKMTNMRTTINFVLFEGSLDNASNFQPLALSPTVTFTDRDAPAHGRLARTSSIKEMRISWTSTTGTCVDCVVQWGLTAEKLDRTSESSTPTTYHASDLCGVPANSSGFHSPGDHFSVVLDLSEESSSLRSAGLNYYYRYGSQAQGWSPVRSFVAPKPVNPHAPMNIMVTADMGETYEDGSQYHWEEPSAVNTTLQMINVGEKKGSIDVVLHPGDLAYATGYASEWDRFMEQIEPLSSTVPYMTGQGNHERDFPESGNSIGGGDSGGECGVPTQSRFPNPVCPSPNTSPCVGTTTKEHGAAFPLVAPTRDGSGPTGSQNDGWYSFEQGSVHFLMLNTEMSSKKDSRQYQFVSNDLATVNRSQTPWVLVFGHRQMYAYNISSPENELGDLEPLLLTNKVDIAFWGHIHFAQATCPMFKGKCLEKKDAAGYDGVIHTVIGNAGQKLTPINYKQQPWSLYNADKFGFSHVEVLNATHLTMNFYNDAPLDSEPTVDYSFDIVRKFPRA